MSAVCIARGQADLYTYTRVNVALCQMMHIKALSQVEERSSSKKWSILQCHSFIEIISCFCCHRIGDGLNSAVCNDTDLVKYDVRESLFEV